jgi:integrase
MTLKEFFDQFYRPLRLRNRSPRTAKSYGDTLAAFSRFLEREAMLTDLDELLIARYLEKRSTTRSPYTAERERTQLCALGGLAAERRLIPHRPAVPQGPLPDRVPRAWSVDEVRQLFAAAKKSHAYVAPGLTGDTFFPALLSVLWETGERIGAALEATWDGYKRPTLIIRAEARKGRRRDRCYRLSDETCNRLDAMPRLPGDRIFPWPEGSKLNIYYHFGRIKKAAGITGKRQAFHQIRRSAASHFAAAGGDPVKMLDHASAATTKRWYLDPRLTDQGEKPCDLLPRITEPPPG